MVRDLRTLWQYRELLCLWTWRNIRVRYKQSLLGIVWAVLQPLSLMIVFSLIFTLFFKVPTGGIPYPVFSYVALLPWTFFSSSLTFSVSSLTNNMGLVTKIYFPREIFPLAAIAASLVDFVVASILFVGLLIFFRVRLALPVVLVPCILLVQVTLTAGLAFLGSALNVFYRDVQFVIPLGLQLWMYASPVIYPTSMVPEHLRAFYWINPMASLIDAYRTVILEGRWPEPTPLLLATAVSIVLLVVGYRVFKKAETVFADII